jgi:hypothetical protein
MVRDQRPHVPQDQAAKSTLGDPGGGTDRAFSLARFHWPAAQTDAPMIATIAMAAGKPTRTKRRKPLRTLIELSGPVVAR